MENGGSHRIDAVAAEILDYLRSHPEAADTLEGIVEWWLMRTRYMRGLERVEEALALLISEGLVRVRENGDFGRIYSAGEALALR